MGLFELDKFYGVKNMVFSRYLIYTFGHTSYMGMYESCFGFLNDLFKEEKEDHPIYVV